MKRALVLLGLLLVAVAFVYPFWWLVSASLKDRAHVFDNALLPAPFSPGNYVEVWRAVPLLTWIGNSVVVGLAAAVAVTLSSAAVAFGFALFRFRGRGPLFGLVLATMMLPAAVTMVPVYLEWHAIGLATTQVPLWAQNLFGSAFYVFLLRQFFLGLPSEVFDAAKVDGASPWRLFTGMALPLARPGLVVVFVFELKNAWTDLVKPLIYLREAQLYTLPRGLKAVLDRFGEGGEAQWELVLAASTVATVPMVLLFLVAQRYFVRGTVTQHVE
ncbi:carbohydrate ABC transporter permease [Saccharothrix coeruleofusca]|uniref:Sugar ABC transporter permease n=1 Tax=Saccharothrix coeruleofusca TaxID=33919 RepID=A0A918EGL0_9PSEU|nr:carbohydrate ABC transporter permease [Saccharothrix coeruleofusca]MBP2336820.1 multiple sugar transport system permease protein [Saccharothrix coeruleofusca]GGP82799.1 sugar ABC transporter permease [Saccharothrix coeruleofusca]